MRSSRLVPVLFSLLSLVLSSTAYAQAASGAGSPGAGSSVTGSIVSINGLSFVVSLADGTQKTIALRDDALILERQVTSADKIKAGDAVGVAARLDNGSLIATNINIFAPEMWQGMRKGQSTMQTGETMTNAMTAEVVQNSKGRVLTLQFDMGSAAITVPDGVPVHRLVSVKPDHIAVGMKVTFRTMPDSKGNLTASSASFDLPVVG